MYEDPLWTSFSVALLRDVLGTPHVERDSTFSDSGRPGPLACAFVPV